MIMHNFSLGMILWLFIYNLHSHFLSPGWTMTKLCSQISGFACKSPRRTLWPPSGKICNSGILDSKVAQPSATYLATTGSPVAGHPCVLWWQHKSWTSTDTQAAAEQCSRTWSLTEAWPTSHHVSSWHCR